MAEVTSWKLGEAEVLRVPYFDIGLPPDAVALTPEAIEASGMAGAPWTDDDGNVVVGQVFWVVRSGGQTIVVDPCSASDGFLRAGPEAITHQDAAFAALSAAGIEADDVDQLVLTHLDGIGMAALATDDGWVPAFRNARYVLTAAERAHLRDHPEKCQGADAIERFAAEGLIDEVDPPTELAPHVRFELTAGHSPGHAAVVVGDDVRSAILFGHLTLSPLHLVDRPDSLHLAPEKANAWIRDLKARVAGQDVLLMGSLWPTPGAVRITRLDPLTVEPVSSLR